MKTATPTLESAPKRNGDVLLRCGEIPDSASQPTRHGVQLAMHALLRRLSEGRNLGPLVVLVAVVIYSLLSPYLPAPIHDYIYHIAH